MRTFLLRGVVWKYPGPGGWHFVSLPKSRSAALKQMPGLNRVGWGNIPVRAKIGTSEWRTALFLTKDGRYLLACDLGVMKPEPEYFLRILRALDLPAHRVAFLDDHEANVAAARELGIRAATYEGRTGASKLWQTLARCGVAAIAD
jgi:hypothetical protein